MKDWKNIVSSIVGLLIAVSGALVGVAAGGEVVFPSWVLTTCIIIMAVGTAVIGWLQGRNANLSRKTKEQLKRQAEAKMLGKDGTT